MNPDHPKAAIYVDYIDKYAEKAAKGELLGGYNYEHFNIFENINIPKQRIASMTRTASGTSEILKVREVLQKA